MEGSMQLRSLGKSDLKISTILMGTWQAGKEMWVDIDDDQSTRAIRAAFESGIVAFDTAAVYGKGHSERILGAAVADIRTEVVLATKVFANRLKYDQVINACHQSLRNLKTDYIDLYQIHWPSGAFGTRVVPIEDTMAAMSELKEKGKIRSIGVSNFSFAQLKEANQYADIDSIQSPYSLFWRHIEKDIMSYCQKDNISILAYSPMAQGLLTGKFTRNDGFKNGDHRKKNRLFGPEHFGRARKALDKLAPIAEAKAVSVGQLALAWVIAQPGTSAIAGARNADQSAQNAKAADISLTDDDRVRIDEIGRIVTDYLDENPVLWRF
jgi:aryl-alcohol dehydrogenase-like predicted oxidoreductase